MGNVRSFLVLVAWQKAKALAVRIYFSTSDYPKTETFGITSQMRRAAVSVSLNIAEGHARNTTGEFKQFLGIAKGSLAELETLIDLSEELQFLTSDISKALIADCEDVQKLLAGLLRSLPKKTNP